jgi:hypothetical protein
MERNFCAFQALNSGLIVCKSIGSACLCKNWDNFFKLISESVSMDQFTFFENQFRGYLVNQPLHFFSFLLGIHKIRRKRELLPAVNVPKYLSPPNKNICCVLILTNWYPQGSTFVYWLISAKHSSVADKRLLTI